MTAVAASEGIHMEQMDVTTSFLYANLEGEVYLEIPEGMFAEAMPGKVLRLLKALYGLKQSPRMWNLHIDKALSEFGLHRLTSDFCVYACFNGPDRVLLGLFKLNDSIPLTVSSGHGAARGEAIMTCFNNQGLRLSIET